MAEHLSDLSELIDLLSKIEDRIYRHCDLAQCVTPRVRRLESTKYVVVDEHVVKALPRAFDIFVLNKHHYFLELIFHPSHLSTGKATRQEPRH